MLLQTRARVRTNAHVHATNTRVRANAHVHATNTRVRANAHVHATNTRVRTNAHVHATNTRVRANAHVHTRVHARTTIRVKVPNAQNYKYKQPSWKGWVFYLYENLCFHR